MARFATSVTNDSLVEASVGGVIAFMGIQLGAGLLAALVPYFVES